MVAAASAVATHGAVAQADTLSRTPGRVTIFRDGWGVPHVYAAALEDGYYGLGYALAEDRLQQVLWRYLMVRGELAAAFGPERLTFGGWTVNPIESDLEQLRWRHLEEARAGYRRMSPALQRAYRYFIAGIARYMTDHPESVPDWAPPLEPALPVAWTRAWFFPWALGGQGAEECRPGGTGLAFEPFGQPVGLQASNEWVLMPWRTADGAVIHLTDSHSPWVGSGEMWEFRIDAGPLKLAASSVLGTAWGLVGHTRYHAWATTNSGNDVVDCYAIRVESDEPRRYRYDESVKRMTTRTVTVQVKGGPPVTQTFEYSDHNDVASLIVARHRDTAFAVSTPYMHRAGMFDEQMFRQQLARTIDEYWAAQAMVDMWPTNHMVGERNGNVLYVRTGRIPRRPAGFDWRRPVPGNTSATAWLGIHPIDELVHLRNPPQGYMSNDNIAPDMMLEDSPLTADRYPPWVFADRPGRTNARGERTLALLSRLYHATLDDAIGVALDERWPHTEAWQTALGIALSRDPETTAGRSVAFRRFVDRVLRFDGHARHESIEALNYLAWLEAVAALDSSGVDSLGARVERGVAPNDADAAWLVAGAERAVADLTHWYGTTEVRYGDVHRVGRGGVSYPLGGGGFRLGSRVVTSLRATWFTAPDSTHQRWAYGGQRQPMLTIFTDPIQSFSWLAVGQSADPASPHYSNQARLMSERKLRPTYFNERDLLRHVTSSTTLEVRVP